MPSKVPTRCISQKKNGELTIWNMICWQKPCKFHIADSVGGGVDKQFIETGLYDRLRLVRRQFVLGQAILYFGEWRINSHLLLRCVMLNRKL